MIAPAACWWARTMALSKKASSTSASPASSANTACHTCARDHLAKRLYSLFRARKSCGRSCHGLPFRAIHSTASTDSRLSAAVRPGSGILPGSNDTIRPYCTSLSINLDILFLRKRQDVDRFLRKLPPPFFHHDCQQTVDKIHVGGRRNIEDRPSGSAGLGRHQMGRRRERVCPLQGLTASGVAVYHGSDRASD